MMRRTVMKGLFIALVAGMLADESTAAVISVQPVIAGFYNSPSYDPIAPIPPRTTPGFAVVVQVDIYMEVLSLAPGEDSFGSAEFSFDIDPCRCTAFPDPEAGGWFAYPHPLVDSNGPLRGGFVQIFALNGDLGEHPLDHKGILVEMATSALTNDTDPRRNVGEPGSPLGTPIALGSAYFEWSGTGRVRITLNPLNVSAKLASTGQFVVGTSPPPAIIELGVCIPEPSSLVVIVGCLAGVVLRRRAA